MGIGRKRQKTFKQVLLKALVWMFLVLFIFLTAILLTLRTYQTGIESNYRLQKQEKLKQLTDSIGTSIDMSENQMVRLLAGSDVKNMIYLLPELKTYDYFTIVKSIAAQVNSCIECFNHVDSLQLYFPGSDIIVDQNERVNHLLIPEELLPAMSNEAASAYQNDLYIVRAMWDYRDIGLGAPCYSIMKISKVRLEETFSYLCQKNEEIQLFIGQNAVYDSDTPDIVYNDVAGYPILVALKLNDESMTGIRNMITAAIYISIGIFVVTLSWFLYYVYKHLYVPVNLLLDRAFSCLEKGQLDYRIPEEASEPFGKIYHTYNTAVDKLEYLMETEYRQKLLISEMNLKQLQAQINPHFMYNTYYTLYRLIQDEDWKNSSRLAEMLGTFFHYITRNGDTQKLLEDEVRHTLVYVQIQSMRFEDMELDIEPLPEEFSDIPVPRLILQPVFENVFQHAQKTLNGEESLKIRMRYEQQDPNTLDIIAENNGNVKSDVVEKLRNSLAHIDECSDLTGLLNIHKRLKLFYGEKAGLTVDKSDLGGLCVRISIMRCKDV